EDVGEPTRTVLSKDAVGLGRGNLADEQVAPANLAAVRLQLDRTLPQQRLAALPDVFHARVVDHQLVVEINGRALADLQDAKVVPFPERLVRQEERVVAGRALGVVVEPATALVGSEVPFATFLGEVPDLNLGGCTQIDAAVGERDSLVVDQQLDVAVL